MLGGLRSFLLSFVIFSRIGNPIRMLLLAIRIRNRGEVWVSHSQSSEN